MNEVGEGDGERDEVDGEVYRAREKERERERERFREMQYRKKNESIFTHMFRFAMHLATPSKPRLHDL